MSYNCWVRIKAILAEQFGAPKGRNVLWKDFSHEHAEAANDDLYLKAVYAEPKWREIDELQPAGRATRWKVNIDRVTDW